MAEKKIHVLSNTHWDREHRHGFQETRLMLVECIDKLIEIMENDPEYRHYTLDGQSIMIDDYLAVKPEMKDRLAKLIREGRILIGPWYSLVDCFAVTPECIVRNLLIGDRVCRQYGEPMRFGYSIFSFGQMAQLPQVYAGFGIDSIVFYKGFSPEVFEQSEFMWSSPDGTKALTSRLGQFHRVNCFVYFTVPVILGGDMMLPGWKTTFTNGMRVNHPVDPHFYDQHAKELDPDIRVREDEIVKRVEQMLEGASASASERVFLGFDGIDFSAPMKELPEAIRLANEKMDGKVELVHSTILDYIREFREDVDTSALKQYAGEMRFGPVWKIHTETMSANMPIKLALHKAETTVLQYAEPLSAFAAIAGMGPAAYPKEMLQLAWKYLLQSHPHDTLHGTGVPKITRDTIYRAEQAQEVADGIATRAMHSLVGQIDTRSLDDEDIMLAVYNPTPYQRSEVTPLIIDLPREEVVKEYWLETLDGEPVPFYQNSRYDKNIASINPDNRPKSIYADRVEMVADLSDIPSCGYTSLKLKRVKGDPELAKMPFPPPRYPFEPIGRMPNVLDNGLVRIEISPNGTLRLVDHETGYIAENLLAFTDAACSGDMWIHREPERIRTLSSTGCAAEIALVENSGLSATFRVTVVLNIPEGLTQDRVARSHTTIPTAVHTEIRLRKGSRRVEFKTSVENRSRDHMLSVSFPTGIQAEHCDWEGPFEVRRRAINDETSDGKGHRGDELVRHAMQRFADVSDGNAGMAILSKGIRELETIDQDGAVLTLTLLRSMTQTFPCHEEVFLEYEQEESQCLGRHCFEYAIFPHAGDYKAGEVIREATCYQMPLAASEFGKGRGGSMPLSQSFLTTSNPNTVITAIKLAEDDDRLIVRLNNPTDETIKETLTFHQPVAKAWLSTMNEDEGELLKADDSKVVCQLRPYRIETIAVRF